MAEAIEEWGAIPRAQDQDLGHGWTRIHTDKTNVVIRVNPCPNLFLNFATYAKKPLQAVATRAWVTMLARMLPA
jgi:hypothetical protein